MPVAVSFSFHKAAVNGVADHGKSQSGAVHPQLVGATGARHQRDAGHGQRVIVRAQVAPLLHVQFGPTGFRCGVEKFIFGEDSVVVVVVSLVLLAMLRDAHKRWTVGIAFETHVEFDGRGSRQVPRQHGLVAFVDSSSKRVAKVSMERLQCRFRQRQDQNAAGIHVEAVYNHLVHGVNVSGLDQVVNCSGNRRVAPGTRHGKDTRRFVDDAKVRVNVQDAEGLDRIDRLCGTGFDGNFVLQLLPLGGRQLRPLF